MPRDIGQLLYSGYPFGDRLKLDLYGLPATEDEGCLVLDATLSGTRVSLAYILDDDMLDEITRWLDERSNLAHINSRREGRAERAAHDRQMAQNDHVWRLL